MAFMGDQSSLLGLPCSCELDACSCIRRARYACFLEVLGVVFITCPLEYWLSSLKVATIVVFIIIGILVNVGVNRDHQYIGAHYWHIPGAPFVGGFGGFARVFVTASFACSYLCPFSYNESLIKRNCRWRYRIPWDYCRGDQKSIKEHAPRRQIRLLEVRGV